MGAQVRRTVAREKARPAATADLGRAMQQAKELVFHPEGPRESWGVLPASGGDPVIKPGIEAMVGNLRTEQPKEEISPRKG